MTTIATNGRSARPTIGRTLLVGLLAGLLAGLANLLVYFVGSALSAPFLVPMGGPGSPPMPLPLLAIIVASTIPALGAAVLYWALGRFVRNATTIFLVVAVVFALISLAGPMSLPIELSTRLSLSAMHFVAGAIIAGGLVRFARQG